MAIATGVAFFMVPFAVQAASVRIPVEKSGIVTEPIVREGIASAILVDVASGKILYAHEPAKTWTAASLTKLMTSYAFTTTPTKWEGNAAILKADEVGGGRLQVSSGSMMTFRDMLYSALIGSANNAAEALGRLFHPRVGKSGFIALMNEEAKRLGLVQSSYYDASGMNEKNTLSAYDTAVLIAKAGEEPEAAKAMSMATYAFTVKRPVIAKTIKNTNDLLFSEKDLVITAGKTGYLNESKYNFVVRAYPKGEPEKELIAVVLGAETRKSSQDDGLTLMRWAWKSFGWDASTSTVALIKNRELGDKGEDIRDLQRYLNAHGFSVASSGAGSPGKETTLLGELTKAALVRYQEAHSDAILAPHGATKGSGYLDYYTRFAIHSGI